MQTDQTRFENSESRLDRIEDKLDEHTAKLDEHTAKLDEHTVKIDENTRAITALREEFVRSFADLFAFLNEKFADVYRHFDMVTEQMRSDSRALAELISDHSRRLGKLEESSDEHETRLGILERQR